MIGNVINNGTIGPPGENDPGFLVGTGGITGSLLNNGKIFGAGNHLGGIGLDEGEDEEGYGILGALTIATNVSGGVTNAGTISSVEGNAIQLGIGGDIETLPRFAGMTGAIVNSGRIDSTNGDGIAALFGSMTGTLRNEQNGVISGVRGVHIASSFDSWTGGINNNGLIDGSASAIRIGDLLRYEAGDVSFSGGITNGTTGRMTSKSGPTLRIGGASFSGGILNAGTITQVLPSTFSFEGQGDGEGILISAHTFNGGISNSGHIDGLAGPAIWIEHSVLDFNDGIRNTGTIKSSSDGVRVYATHFNGGFVNEGLIRGGNSDAGILIAGDSFNGNFSNSGTITGGSTGVSIVANTFHGHISNSGLIAGGVFISGEHAVSDPGLTINVTTQYGDIVNSGTLSATSDAMDLTIGTLIGSVTNSGLIEATESGSAAVRLKIGNGANFTNTGGGRIVGDVFFGGKNDVFIGRTGGVEGNLIGGFNVVTQSYPDSIVIENGSQYFVAQGASGAGLASNFASFSINNLGIAVVGAKSIGSANGNGYNLSNVAQLNLNQGGQLYVDNQSSLGVGGFHQAAGSTLSLNLSKPASGSSGTVGVNFGQIHATGPVSLGGTLQAAIDPLAFSGTGLSQYSFTGAITTTGTITGDFADEGILGGSFFYRLEHTTGLNSIDLRLVRLPFTAPDCSDNGQRLGELLEKIYRGGNLTPPEQALFTFLSNQSAGTVCDAIDEVGATKIADLGSIVIETAGPWKSLVNDRLSGLGAVGCNLAGPGGCLNRFASNETQATQVMTDATPGSDPFDWLKTGTRRVGDTASWGRMVGVWGGTDSIAGVGGMDFNLTGGIVGVDHVISETLLAGVAVQFSTDDLNFKQSVDDASINSMEVGAYASYGDTRFYVNVNTSFIWHDFKVQRAMNAGGAFGSYNGTTLSAYVEAGRIFEYDDFRIQPILAASFAHLQTDSYAEQGQALGLLAVNDADFTTFKGNLGARLALPFTLESGRKIVPEARVALAHEFADNQSSFWAKLKDAPASDPFLVKGRRYKRDSLVLGAGLSAPLSEDASVSLDYDASINPDIVSHTVSAGLRFTW